MFERFTEDARRALFFARYETSQRGGTSIDGDHLLLGLIRNNKGAVPAILAHFHIMASTLQHEIDATAPLREKISTAVEIPFSREVKNMLGAAGAEADRLQHAHIGSEHLLLGILSEGGSPAAEILTRHGVTPEAARSWIASAGSSFSSDHPGTVDLQLQD